MEPKNHSLCGLSQKSASLMDGEEGRQTVYRRPVGLTITVEKIDRVLADVQTQIETLRQKYDKSATGEGAVGRHGSKVGRRMNDATVSP